MIWSTSARSSSSALSPRVASLPPVRLLALGGLDAVHTQAIYHLLAAGMSERAVDTVVLTWPHGGIAVLVEEEG